ncbi:sulfoquinovosidase-like [Pecten maximus]|uniref:sulfoquinovosidase-like n=1 Tax=Pecten maximus TaxID=6579 RepID=UPI001458241A|nr:sulfoquinovosidase-like [Pecten maximus]
MTTRAVLYITLIAVHLFVAVSGEKKYAFTLTYPDGFNISINNITIFQHSRQNPMIYVGEGHTNFLGGLGNFHINNVIQDRIPLRTFEHITTADKNYVLFKYSGDEFLCNVTFESTSDSDLVVSTVDVGSTPYQYLWLRVVAEQTEKVFGGGEQFSHFNLRDRTYMPPEIVTVLRADDLKYPIWTREQGVGRDKSNLVTYYADLKTGGGGAFHTTYYPQPSYVSTRKYYLHYKDTNYMVLDFSSPTYHEIFVKGIVGKFYFKTADTMLALVQSLSQFQGRMPALPDWVTSGITIGVQGGTDTMLARLKTVQDAGIKVNGLWIQDWSGDIHTSFGKRVFWNWKLNTTLYTKWNETIADLQKQGIRVLAYVNPNLNKDGDLFKDADSKGYFIKDPKTDKTLLTNFGEFFCGSIDFTNPNAFSWYKDTILRKNMIDIGLGGWMADFGEYLPTTAKFFTGSGETLHNRWPLYWAQMNRIAIQESGKEGEVVFFMRSGYSGISNFTTLMWAGDQNVNFDVADGLASTVVAALSAGVSGIGMTHFDIGGYTTFASMGLKRTPELLIRSGEMAVFTPYMRTHEGNQPEANIQVYSNKYILQHFARLSKAHSLLANYTRAAVAEYIQNGTPVQRPMFFVDQTEKSYAAMYQYMYGPDLVVAPIVTQGATSRDIYLPQGTWINIWDEGEYAGYDKYINMSAPLGKPLVFYNNESKYKNVFKCFKQLPAPPTPPPTPPTTPTPVAPCVNKGAAFGSGVWWILLTVFTVISYL